MAHEINRLNQFSRLLKIEKTNLDIAVRAFEKQRHLVELSDARIKSLEKRLEALLDSSSTLQENGAGSLINRMNRINGIELQLLTEKSLNTGLNQSLSNARQTVLNHRTKVKGTELRVQNMAMELQKKQDKVSEADIMDHVLQQQIGIDQ